MVQRLHLTMEVTEKPDGSYEAHCPELSMSASGRYAEEAVDKLKEIVFSSMSDGFDLAFTEENSSEQLFNILAQNKQCFLHIPREPQIH